MLALQRTHRIFAMRRPLFSLLNVSLIASSSSGRYASNRLNQSHRNDIAYIDSMETHVFRESIPQLSSRRDLEKKDRLTNDHIHEVVIAIKPKNMEELTRILHDVSDPVSENYGRHLTRNEVRDLTSNPGANLAVTSYLGDIGASIVSESLDGEYITATAPIHIWEEMFHAEFHTFGQTHQDGIRSDTIRAEEYWIPSELHEHIEYVMNVVDVPCISQKGPTRDVNSKTSRKLFDKAKFGQITPLKLREAYNMSNSQGSILSTQAVYTTGRNYFGVDDLAWFQANMSGQALQPAISINDHNSTDCEVNQCTEGNLNLQYLMAMSPVSPTYHWYSRFGLFTWLRLIAETPTIPLVLSVSYGAYEKTTSIGEKVGFVTLAKKFGVMGSTIVVACGNTGAADTLRGRYPTCRYNPDFPGSSPYVVSVGATTVR